jgi:hypothetical protein
MESMKALFIVRPSNSSPSSFGSQNVNGNGEWSEEAFGKIEDDLQLL